MLVADVSLLMELKLARGDLCDSEGPSAFVAETGMLAMAPSVRDWRQDE